MQRSFVAYLEEKYGDNDVARSVLQLREAYYAGWRAANRDAQERLYERMRPGIDVV